MTSKKSISKVLTSIGVAFTMCFTSFSSINNSEMTFVDAASNGFYVNGTTLCDANGNPFVMRGINVAHAWYQDQTETSIKAIANTGANTVRVVLADGVQWTKTSASDVQKIIDVCKENKLVCVLEIHDATGRDSLDDLMKAVNYWKEIKDILNANKEYVIVNIANEWYGTWDGQSWADGYKTALKEMRDAGIENTIMIDCAGWGQYPASVHNYGAEVFAADSLKNTMFSIHMYEYAGGNESMVKENIDKALAINVPLVIGEFGSKHTDGDVDEATILSYCETMGAGYLGWSWKGNGDTWAYLDIANDFAGNSYSEWGDYLINSTNGIKNTSKICTVYKGEKPDPIEPIVTTTTDGDTPIETTITATSPVTELPADYPIKGLKGGDVVSVVVNSTSGALVNGCFGYSDADGNWIKTEWEIESFNKSGKETLTFTVPDGITEIEFQIWWASVGYTEVSASMEDYSINGDSEPITTTTPDTTEPKETTTTTVETTGIKELPINYPIKGLKGGDVVSVVVNSASGALVNGCFGYSDANEDWIKTEWEIESFNKSGKETLTFTVPDGITEIEFQIWWASVGYTEVSASMEDYSINGDSEPITTAPTNPTNPTDSIVVTILGDANCDGKVSVADVVAAAAVAADPDSFKLSQQGTVNADIHLTGDGISATDASMIQELAIGL